LAGPDDDVLDHVGSMFRNWTDCLVVLFVAGGMSKDATHRMAAMTIAATEGPGLSDLVRDVT
jgi:hypothetical protein